jgi:hypothetical protein
MSGLWETIKSPFVWMGQKASNMVYGTPAAPVVSDTAAITATGAAPETPGTTVTGGRRHKKTQKHHKSPRKTRRQRRHHGKY